MSQIQAVVAELVAEGEEIDALVAGLDPARWAETPTAASGWSIQHQIAHLTFVFELAATAASDAAAFAALTESAATDFQGAVDAALNMYLAVPSAALLERWRQSRAKSAAAMLAVPEGELVPWLVNPLPATVLAAAGMMELFGHGQDIADALGIRRTYTDRIGILTQFAVRVWEFGYQARGLTPPATEFRFELTAPSGALWTYGPEDAAQRITGPAVDFCLLVVRRRHRDDLALKAVGVDADQWLNIAQAYRGPAGEGRKAGQCAGAR